MIITTTKKNSSKEEEEEEKCSDMSAHGKLHWCMQMQPAPHAPADTLGVRPQTTAGLVSNSLLERSTVSSEAGSYSKRPTTSMSVHLKGPAQHIYSSASVPNIAYRNTNFSRKIKRKPPLPKTPNKLSRQQRHDDVDGDKNNALLVEVPAPATPRMGNKQYNDVVSVSRALSIRESIVPEDIHANSIWEKGIPRTPNTPNISYGSIFQTNSDTLPKPISANSSAIRPGTKGREIMPGPVQYRALTGKNADKSGHTSILNYSDDTGHEYSRSNTPIYQQQVVKRGELRSRLKSGVLLPMGLGERYSVEVLR